MVQRLFVLAPTVSDVMKVICFFLLDELLANIRARHVELRHCVKRKKNIIRRNTGRLDGITARTEFGGQLRAASVVFRVTYKSTFQGDDVT